MWDKLKTALVLVVIGAISGLLIWGINELTAETIIENRLEREKGYYKEIFDIDGDITFDTLEMDGVLNAEITIYDQDGQEVGYIYRGAEKNNYGDITVLVGVYEDGTIASVVISNTTNTPTFVNEIKTNYLSPFEGQDTALVTFDAKTGATYTYTSVSHIVTLASEYFEESRGE